MRSRFCRMQLELAAGADATRQVEACLGVEGQAEALEGLLPPVVAEVVEAGGGHGRCLEDLGVQRDHRATVVAQPAPEGDHLVGPGAARRRGPGHGAPPYLQRGRLVCGAAHTDNGHMTTKGTRSSR